ncbi:MAG TPA: hypothetical protein VK670_14905 [Silvibacterium sp.]|nr:hypothetical protein [Silvibacterium sp.]
MRRHLTFAQMSPIMPDEKYLVIYLFHAHGAARFFDQPASLTQARFRHRPA